MSTETVKCEMTEAERAKLDRQIGFFKKKYPDFAFSESHNDQAVDNPNRYDMVIRVEDSEGERADEYIYIISNHLVVVFFVSEKEKFVSAWTVRINNPTSLPQDADYIGMSLAASEELAASRNERVRAVAIDGVNQWVETFHGGAVIEVSVRNDKIVDVRGRE